mgnify:FL=1|tara:strand:- start:287 stop:901 length:615 start_codon:yes stop_codon:yes gene_type:complete
MTQGDLFQKEDSLVISGDQGEAEYVPNFFSKEEADKYFNVINSETPWNRPHIKMFDKSIPVPRDTAWYGEKGYVYSGINNTPLNLTNTLQELKTKVSKKCDAKFNSLLLNRYQSGIDKLGWHADDEPELRKCLCIASLSFGAGRDFRIRKKRNFRSSEDKTHKIFLEHGSLLIMRAPLQTFWEHEVPKRKTENSRINLTFRYVS